MIKVQSLLLGLVLDRVDARQLLEVVLLLYPFDLLHYFKLVALQDFEALKVVRLILVFEAVVLEFVSSIVLWNENLQ